MLEREAVIFERRPSWRTMHPERERDFVLVAFRESDSHPNHVLVESSWRTVVALESHLLLETDQVVVGHSILPIVLDDNCSRMEVVDNQDSILLH